MPKRDLSAHEPRHKTKEDFIAHRHSMHERKPPSPLPAPAQGSSDGDGSRHVRAGREKTHKTAVALIGGPAKGKEWAFSDDRCHVWTGFCLGA